MKILHVALITPTSPQWGLRNALKSIATEYRELDWLPLWNEGNAGARASVAILEANQTFKPDLTFLQLQTPDVLYPIHARQMGGYLFSWNGDVRDNTPQWSFELGKAGVHMAYTNLRDVDNLRTAGVKADYLQIGFDPVTFNNEGTRGYSSDLPPIVFLGNNYGSRFPMSVQRQHMVGYLRKRYGDKFQVFGGGWGFSKWLNEAEEAHCYRSCRIAIGQHHYLLPRWTSDRTFRAMGCGAFYALQRYPQMEKEFREGKDFVGWDDFDELGKVIDYYLDHEGERKAIAAEGCRQTRAVHTWASRMPQLLQLIGKS